MTTTAENLKTALALIKAIPAGGSSAYWRLEDRADEHEAENPGHTVRTKEPL